MRSNTKLVIAAVLSTFVAGGALAAPRDPLVVPGIGPNSWSAAVRYPRYKAMAYPVQRQARAAEVAIREASSFYDDEYRPAAYTAADAYPPPSRPWLRVAPSRRKFAGCGDGAR